MPRHGGSTVVQNDDGYLALIVNCIYQSGNTGMQERGITDYCYHLASYFSLFHAQCLSDAGTHAGGGIHGAERRIGGECITTDITGNNQLRLLRFRRLQQFGTLPDGIEDKEHAGMGAAGAEEGRAFGQPGGHFNYLLRWRTGE